MANSGKTTDLPEVEVVANAESDDDVFATAETIINDGDTILTIGKGWRLERNSNGRLRWRWQRKHENGTPMTYTAATGNVGYKRGSKYVPKKQEQSELIQRLATA